MIEVDVYERALSLHASLRGKIEISPKFAVRNRDDLSLAYTPGVAEPCRRIAKNREAVYDYTIKSNSVAVVSDGSAVLGLGRIGAEAALPVMEGKALLFKQLAGIDAFPICLSSYDVEENILTVKNIAPVFGGINIEDVRAPECFAFEEGLKDVGIPVMHDDRHGTAIVVLAALLNSLKVVDKDLHDVKIVINGAGAAGTGIVELLNRAGCQDIIVCDSKGIIHMGREDVPRIAHKRMIASVSSARAGGTLADAVKGADVFVGVSVGNVLSRGMVRSMAQKPVVIAMANPVPEINPKDAREAGARVVATGRSDYPNQVNNVLAFPGVFRGALDARAKEITWDMKTAAAHALASLVPSPTPDCILPSPLDPSVVPTVSRAVASAYQ